MHVVSQTNRTAAYFEYPSTVAILQREIHYGIELDFAHVTVKPLMSKPGPFSYHVGNVNVNPRVNTWLLYVSPREAPLPSYIRTLHH